MLVVVVRATAVSLSDAGMPIRLSHPPSTQHTHMYNIFPLLLAALPRSRPLEHTQPYCLVTPTWFSLAHPSCRGVFWDKKSGRWRSQMGFKNNKLFMGYYDRVEDAARAYDRKAVEVHGRLGEYLPEGVFPLGEVLSPPACHLCLCSTPASYPAALG